MNNGENLISEINFALALRLNICYIKKYTMKRDGCIWIKTNYNDNGWV
ncbi:MAG: hypothetical protein JETT_0828 [Candidatus Jettenia ecosi]|uniref:Uncharacterized protein n=1 Tax=Candidatus Jettenia ecosi TaxID=2494326 RepID=A0A533QDH7_9BACT|nr:MAG: hypothetical protein JETT_0828 [Candidatus Jettenia ecosi]